MYKNWPAICQVENDLLRLLVSTNEEESLLTKLKCGFPELFSETPLVEPRVPVSVIRHAAREFWIENGAEGDYLEEDAELDWLPALEKFDIPTVWSWNDNDIAPLEIRRQLVGQRLQGGMNIVFKGQECVSVLYFLEDQRFGRIIKRVPRNPTLVLVLKKFIDCEK